MAIYTKTGDNGETSLASGARVAKTDARIEAYGTVDELNSWVGMLRASLLDSAVLNTAQATEPIKKIQDQLSHVQNKLFNLGAALSEAPGEWISEEDIHVLETWIDEMQAIVPKQKAFILPMGSEPVCRCHICRTVCRRVERKMIAANAELTLLQYINRLSDFLFVLARYFSHLANEEEYNWKQA